MTTKQRTIVISISAALILGIAGRLTFTNKKGPTPEKPVIASQELAKTKEPKREEPKTEGEKTTPKEKGITKVGMTPTVFGQKGAVSLRDIPQGNFLNEVLNLTPEAQKEVLKELEKFQIPFLDTHSLHADPKGRLYYTCKSPKAINKIIGQAEAAPANPTTATFSPQVSGTNSATPPVLHSKPGSNNSIYLNFVGATLTTSQWSSKPIIAPAYDLDGDPTTFNPGEAANITEIWRRVANHYKQFDVDVTTEAPEASRSNVSMALITKSTGTNLPSPEVGGIAYMSCFTWPYPYAFKTCFVYYNNSGGIDDVGECASHEVGHTMGLSHEGLTVKGG